MATHPGGEPTANMMRLSARTYEEKAHNSLRTSLDQMSLGSISRGEASMAEAQVYATLALAAATEKAGQR